MSIVAVEGNIGSGKSTVIDFCKNMLLNKEYKKYPSYFNQIHFLKDPYL